MQSLQAGSVAEYKQKLKLKRYIYIYILKFTFIVVTSLNSDFENMILFALNISTYIVVTIYIIQRKPPFPPTNNPLVHKRTQINIFASHVCRRLVIIYRILYYVTCFSCSTIDYSMAAKRLLCII